MSRICGVRLHHQPSDEIPSSSSWIGRAIKRREDLRFLQGRARYVDDIVFRDMAYLAIVRSTHAHARLKGMKLDKARRAPGVVRVVTARDLAGRIQPMAINPLQGDYLAPVPHPVLATEKVRYVGEPVVAVLAETRGAAADAAVLVQVDYEPLPPLTDPR